jgi:acyl transferase domain-containing protein
MIMLKPLDQAIRDNDPIRAVISGTGINQDGKTPGITMPSGEAQGQSYTERTMGNVGHG